MLNQLASAAGVLFGLASALCLSCVFAAVPVRAQQSTLPGPPAPGNRDPVAEARERQRREAQLRSLEMMGGAKKADRRGAEAAAEQMREDFRGIQLLRNRIVRHLLAEQPLDYKFIAGGAEEINERAGRLKSQLLRETPAGEKGEAEKRAGPGDEAQVKEALVRMCRRIDSFTENPVFKFPDVVDVEQTARAGRDLDEVIRLSDAVRKAAERLRKKQKD
jgi:hypothetical protein